MAPTWLALLTAVPDDVVIERKPVASPQMLASGQAGPIAGWESLRVHLSHQAGLRHLLVTIDERGALLSANDGVTLHREEMRGAECWNIYDHESLGGRFETDGSFRGTRWVTRTEQLGDDETAATSSSTPSTPTPEDVERLRVLVAWVMARAPKPQPLTAAPAIRRVHRLDARLIAELAALTKDCVDGGASIGFMQPFPLERGTEFWTRIAEAVAAGQRALLVAEDNDGVCGTVQLILDQPDNQPHRADLAKMQVHRRVRRQGVGAALLAAAERTAKECGKTLLVLDAVTDGDAARLYAKLGWVRVGDIPNFALFPQGGYCSTTYFYKALAD